MILGKRALQLKFVKTDKKLDDTIVVDNDNVQTVQAYAEIVKDVAGEIATLVIVTIVVKTACDISRAVINGIFK